MTTLDKTPFSTIDLFFRDFLHKHGQFTAPETSKSSYPVDIFETSQGMHFEIPCAGLTKKDVEITVKSDVLRIEHEKESTSDLGDRKYYCKGVASRSFSLGYKFSSKFNLTKVDATFNNGMLSIFVPYTKEAETTKVTIK